MNYIDLWRPAPVIIIFWKWAQCLHSCMKVDIYQPQGKRRLFSVRAREQVQCWVLLHTLLQAFKKRIAKSIIETYSMLDPKNSDTTPNRRQFGSFAQSTSLTEAPNHPEPRSRQIFSPKVWSSCEQIYRRGSRRYIFVHESVSPASATSSWDQILCCSFDSGSHPWKQFDGEGRKRQYFVALWKVILEGWRKVTVWHHFWLRVNSRIGAGSE